MAEETTEVKSTIGHPLSPKSPTQVTIKSNNSPRSPAKQPRRLKLTDQQLESVTKEELVAKWREQDLYVECLEAQTTAQEGEIAGLRESEEKYRQQYGEATHREKILVRRLTSKEQELQEYVNQITEMKASQTPSATSLRSALLDPAVNILIQKLRQELITTKAKLEDTQSELSAWKFTPDSNTGKRLMAKCRLLYQENEELGRMIASGRIAKLEGELALQKSFSEEVKKSQSELDEFLQDLDEDVEGMQSTIYFLQQELRKARESVTLLQQENSALKSTSSSMDNNLSNGLSPHTPPIKKEDDDNDDDGENNHLPSSAQSSTATCSEMNNKINSDDCKIGARTPPLPSAVNANENDVEIHLKNNDTIDESSNDSAALIIKVENEELSDRDDDEDKNERKINDINEDNNDITAEQQRKTRTKGGNKTISGAKTNGEDARTSMVRDGIIRDRTKRDKSSVQSSDDDDNDDDDNNERCVKKKKRRESILSIDYEADDDALVLTNGETLQSDPE